MDMFFKLTDKIDNENYQGVLIEKVWQFSSKNDLFMSNNIEKIVRGEKVSHRRLMWITYTRICLIITGIRFLSTLIFWDSPIVSTLLANMNSSYGFEAGRIIIIYLGIGTLNCSFFGVVFQYFEHGNKLKTANILHSITKNTTSIRLRYQSNRRLTIILHLITKYMLYQFYIIFFFILFCFNYIAFCSYSGPLFILTWIIWSIPTLISIRFISCLFSGGPILSIYVLLYLRYAFKDIEHRFRLYVNWKNTSALIRIIDEHKCAVQICQDINEMAKYLLFNLYYSASPICMLLLYEIIYHNEDIIIQITMYVLFIILFAVVFGLIFLGSSITLSAHRPRLYLYRCLNWKTLTIRGKLRIISFIENLCGPVIGIYCLDLFPLNNYEFYEYCTNCAKNFLLFHTLIQEMIQMI